MKKEKIIFMGTPPIARTMLEQLTEADYDVVLVVTQPDRKSGRKQLLTMSAVKEYALSKGLVLFQPEDIKSDHAKIMETDADLIVTCAYGQFVPEQVLMHPRFTPSICIHRFYRSWAGTGAQGDHQWGCGDRNVRCAWCGGWMPCRDGTCHADQRDGYGRTLFDKLAVAGGDLLIEQLPSLFDGSAVFVEQDESQATFPIRSHRRKSGSI
ncbi:MAG: formyltransferase family protein [Merdibacter sp.]